MNERIRELAVETGWSEDIRYAPRAKEIEKFAELIIQECNQAVLSVPCYYKDYRSQIEESVINDCGRAVLDHFGVES